MHAAEDTQVAAAVLASVQLAAGRDGPGEDGSAGCGCDDCVAATSPLAFLADLLGYSGRRLVDTTGAGSRLGARGVAELLRQPLLRLPLSCTSSVDEHSQVRLCVESLERLFREGRLAAADAPVGIGEWLLSRPMSFVVTADVDGDGRQELVVGFDESSVLPEVDRSGIWVLRYDPTARRWRHLHSGPDAYGAALLLPAGLHATAAFSARLTPGREQLVVEIRDRGGTDNRFWVLQYEPDGPQAFSNLDTPLIGVTGAIAADVDGDGRDEIVGYGPAPPASPGGPERPDAFWVYRLEGGGWISLAAPGAADDVAFTCVDPLQWEPVPARIVRAGDVNRDGRAEIVALPDADGNLGKNPWVMRYGGAPGQWSHLVQNTGLPLNADLLAAPAAGTSEHVLVGSVADRNRPDIVVGQGEWPGSDVNRFTIFRSEPGDFAVLGTADGSDEPLPADRATLADIDGDGLDELVVTTHLGRNDRRDAGWVLERQPGGAWGHLSPIGGHPMGADLSWSDGDWLRPRHLTAGDVDGDGRDEIIVGGVDVGDVRVMKYDPDAGTWRHLSAVLPSVVADRYTAAAYRMLLVEMGTSYDELRTARTAPDADRQALAERLGLPGTDQRPDALDALLLPPAPGMDSLEALFGLPSTRRSPLLAGPVSGPGAERIMSWELTGACWSDDDVSGTVDADGCVHLSLSRDATDAVVVVFRDAPRTAPVALGQGDPAAPITLHEYGASGVAGQLRLEPGDPVDGTVLRVFPSVAVQRWRRLRRLWDAEDRPDDPYRSTGAAPRRPIVDPALIGPDDFRLPVPKPSPAAPDAAFDVWLRRRAWLDDVLDDLRAVGDDVPALLAFTRGGPWQAAPADLDGLAETLAAGNSAAVRAATGVVTTRLFLPVDAFLRLMALGQATEGADFVEIRAILALAHMRARFTVWRQEEAEAGIRLDAAAFVTVAPAVGDGDWSPEPASGGARRRPLLDPQRVALDDLPVSVAGDEARMRWLRRTAELDAAAEAVHAARPWPQQLIVALGDAPAAPGGWPAWIAARATELDSADPKVVAAAAAAVQDRLGGMAVPAFRRLAAVNAALTDGRDVPAAARTDAERLLIAAHAVVLLHPTWLAQEDGARPLPYWRIRRLRLTRWLASADDRQTWLAALTARGGTPVIDPDVVGFNQIRTAAATGLASAAEKLWTARRAHLFHRETALRASAGSSLAAVDALLLSGLFTDAERAAVRADTRARRVAGGARTLVEEVFEDDTGLFPALRAALEAGGAAAEEARRVIAVELAFSDEADFRTVTDVLAQDPGAQDPRWDIFDRILADAGLLRLLVRAEYSADRRGMSTAQRLAPLRVPVTAWRRLLAVRGLSAAGGPLLDAETDDLIAILLRTEKERLYGRWQDAEAELAVRRGPDSFRSTADDAAPSAWLATAAEIRRWRETLRARTAQHAQVLEQLRAAVELVEQAALPGYRDELLAALPVPATEDQAGADLDAGARWAADHLLVDTTDTGVRRTTRAAHGIDAVLTLLWSVRTGQLADTYPNLVLDAPTFDQDWRWIGSYATWRSAMLVHLYPESLLRPSLRRFRSPALSTALVELRDARQLDPSRARRIAAGYADYFRDVCNLDVQVGRFFCAESTSTVRPAGHEAPGARGRCEFVVAASGGTGRLYWCVRDGGSAGAAEAHQSFWEALATVPQPGAHLVGAVCYEPQRPGGGGTGWVYVFAVVPGDSGGTKLVYTRRPLGGRGDWQAAEELETPGSTETFAVSVLNEPSSQPPALGFEFPGRPPEDPRGRRHVARMNQNGTRWNGDGIIVARTTAAWVVLATHRASATPRRILRGDVDGDGQDELIVVPAGAGAIEVYIEVYKVTYDPYAPIGRRYGFTRFGVLTPPVEDTALVCVADLNGDGAAEIAWTLGYRPDVPGRASTVMVRRLDLADNRWKPLVAGDIEGAGFRCAAHPNAFAESVVAGHLDGGRRAALVLTNRTHSDLLPGPVADAIENSGPSLWIAQFDGQSFAVPPSTLTPGPADDYRSRYERDTLRLAVRSSPTQILISLLTAADFDGDGRDEFLLLPTARRGAPSDNYSVANDFWVWDTRAADGRLAPLGAVAANEWRTVGDLSESETLVGSVVTADVDGDGRAELIAFPFTPDENAGTSLWVADFRPDGGADPGAGGSWTQLPGIDLSAEGSRPAFAVAGDFDGDGADELLLFGNGRSWGRKYDAAAGAWRQFAHLPDGAPLATVALATGGRFTGGATQVVAVAGTVSAPEPAPIVYTWGSQQPAAGLVRRYEFTADGSEMCLLQHLPADAFDPTPPCQRVPLIPVGIADDDARAVDGTARPDRRRAATEAAFLANTGARASMRTYLWEAFYDLPVAVALALQDSYAYTHSLDWFRLVYDYSQRPGRRHVCYGLTVDAAGTPERAEADPDDYARSLLDWVRDPLDPHATAATRPYTYTRATLQLLVRCLIDAADAEFTRDTAESLDRARVLYGTARDLLAEPVLQQRLGACPDVIVRIPAGTVNDAVLRAAIDRLQVRLGTAADRGRAREAAVLVARALADGATPVTDRLRTAERLTVAALAGVPARRAGHPAVRAALQAIAAAPEAASPVHAPIAATPLFCVGPNPVLAALALHVELNLFKLGDGRNIAGMRRRVDTYAAPTDQISGLPMIGAAGQLLLAGRDAAAPTPYRYQSLIEQARALAAQARDVESLLLAALERRDAEAMTVLRARQEVRTARAGVRLQDLRVREAEDSVALAVEQQRRAEFEEGYWGDMVSAGLNQYERAALGWLEAASRWQVSSALVQQSLAVARGIRASAYYYWGMYREATDMTFAATENTAAALAGLAQNASLWSQWNTMQAGFARTQQDWAFRQQIARYERSIAGLQVAVQTDGLRVVEQERTISELQAENAEQLLEFQDVKFTNADLYDWMSGVLERSYRWFLQQATATAQLAAQQLAFERQEGSPPPILADYWQPPTTDLVQLAEGDAGPDRRGLTGATRLLQDIAGLEQYAFRTAQRKLQLSETVSLAQRDPLGLARLRETGVVTFATPMRLFNEVFPGHYLRLIRRVTVSVIALIPPAEGLHATLSCTGVSRVVVGPDVFRTEVLRRAPESVALSAPLNATGTFVFEQRPDGMRDPFEGLGVDTVWELRIPKPGNLFDLDTVADVLMTVDYTALDSADYRARVVRELDQTRGGDRGFSLRQDFPDAWWELLNPDLAGTPMQTAFTVRRDDFPPHLEGLLIEHVAVCLVTESAPPAPLSTITLHYSEGDTDAGRVGGTGTVVDGTVSTRRANGGPWLSITGKPPAGRWEVALPDAEDVRAWLAAEQLTDILLVVSYAGQTPAWPR